MSLTADITVRQLEWNCHWPGPGAGFCCALQSADRSLAWPEYAPYVHFVINRLHAGLGRGGCLDELGRICFQQRRACSLLQ